MRLRVALIAVALLVLGVFPLWFTDPTVMSICVSSTAVMCPTSSNAGPMNFGRTSERIFTTPLAETGDPS